MISWRFNVFGLRHYLPLYEVPLATANPPTIGPRVRPLASADPPRLYLTAIGLAHAIVKSDCYRRRRFDSIRALAFLFEHHQVFDWTREELRLKDDGRDQYFDFVNNTLIGRIGNGLSLLTAHELGFPFYCHVRTELKRNNIATTTQVPGKNGKMKTVPLPFPDFLCVNASQERAAIEAKGGFPQIGARTDVRADLCDGLSQLSNLPPVLGVTKTYCIASYLRERADTHAEGSMIAFVDPEEGPGDLVDGQISREEVIKQNYASWFVAMGMADLAARLRGEAVDQQTFLFEAYRIETGANGRRWIAFPRMRSRDNEIRRFLAANLFMPWFGIDDQYLVALSRLFRGSPDEFRDVHTFRTDTFQVSDDNGGSFSIFPDGTFFGGIPREALREPRYIEVEF